MTDDDFMLRAVRERAVHRGARDQEELGENSGGDGIEEEFGYLNDPTSDAFKAITYAAGLYGTKHKVFRDNYFKELEELSEELINRLEAYE